MVKRPRELRHPWAAAAFSIFYCLLLVLVEVAVLVAVAGFTWLKCYVMPIRPRPKSPQAHALRGLDEAMRGLVVSTVPAAFFVGWLILGAPALELPFLIIPAPLAVAATVLGLWVLGVVWFRARRRSASAEPGLDGLDL